MLSCEQNIKFTNVMTEKEIFYFLGDGSLSDIDYLSDSDSEEGDVEERELLCNPLFN